MCRLFRAEAPGPHIIVGYGAEPLFGSAHMLRRPGACARILVAAAVHVLGRTAPTTTMIGIDETRARNVHWFSKEIGWRRSDPWMTSIVDLDNPPSGDHRVRPRPLSLDPPSILGPGSGS
jgi:hypothetical protein